MQCCYFKKHIFFSAASLFASIDYNIQSTFVCTNQRPGPVNTNWGDKVGVCKLKPRAEPPNTNLGFPQLISMELLNIVAFQMEKVN